MQLAGVPMLLTRSAMAFDPGEAAKMHFAESMTLSRRNTGTW